MLSVRWVRTPVHDLLSVVRHIVERLRHPIMSLRSSDASLAVMAAVHVGGRYREWLQYMLVVGIETTSSVLARRAPGRIVIVHEVGCTRPGTGVNAARTAFMQMQQKYPLLTAANRQSAEINSSS